MAEWLIAQVLKTGIVLYSELSRVRIPLSPFARSIELFPYLNLLVLLRLVKYKIKENGSAISPSRARKKRN